MAVESHSFGWRMPPDGAAAVGASYWVGGPPDGPPRRMGSRADGTPPSRVTHRRCTGSYTSGPPDTAAGGAALALGFWVGSWYCETGERRGGAAARE
eukprot:jgi/Chrpa1/13608/Chrysochromulina_OHIO_Genome00007150-RA